MAKHVRGKKLTDYPFALTFAQSNSLHCVMEHSKGLVPGRIHISFPKHATSLSASSWPARCAAGPAVWSASRSRIWFRIWLLIPTRLGPTSSASRPRPARRRGRPGPTSSARPGLGPASSTIRPGPAPMSRGPVSRAAAAGGAPALAALGRLPALRAGRIAVVISPAPASSALAGLAALAPLG